MSSPAEYNDNLASLAALPALLEKWGYPDACLLYTSDAADE